MHRTGAGRGLAVAVALVALVVGLTACTGDDDGQGDASPATTTRLLDAPRLTACLDPARQPYTMHDSDAPQGVRGFDVDLLTLVAARLGADLVIRPTPDVGLNEALAARQCDLAGGGTLLGAVDPDTATRPYTRTSLMLVVRRERATTITSTADLAGRRVAAQAGSAAQRFVAALPGLAGVVPVDTAAAALAAVEGRLAEAAVVDRDDASAPMAGHPDLVPVASVAVGDAVVFAVRAATLRQDVNEALTTLADAGTIGDLEQRWAGPIAARS